MKFLFLSSLLAALLAAALSDQMSPNKGECVIGKLKIPAGDTVQDKNTCRTISCFGSNALSFAECGSQTVSEGYMLGNPGKPFDPYPNCCIRDMVPKK